MIIEYRLVPARIDRRARLVERRNAHALYGAPFAELPLEGAAIDEIAQPRMEGHDVVIPEIHLDESLPGCSGSRGIDPVELVAGEVETSGQLHASEIGRRRARPAEEEPVPRFQRLALQVQARRLGEMRRTHQPPREIVGPAVQRADDFAGLPSPCSMMACRWRQTLDSSAGPWASRTSALAWSSHSSER